MQTKRYVELLVKYIYFIIMCEQSQHVQFEMDSKHLALPSASEIGRYIHKTKTTSTRAAAATKEKENSNRTVLSMQHTLIPYTIYANNTLCLLCLFLSSFALSLSLSLFNCVSACQPVSLYRLYNACCFILIRCLSIWMCSVFLSFLFFFFFLLFISFLSIPFLSIYLFSLFWISFSLHTTI